jgi:hypothetical protein
MFMASTATVNKSALIVDCELAAEKHPPNSIQYVANIGWDFQGKQNKKLLP